MNSLISIIGIIGSVASLIGAFLSYKSKNEARDAAAEVKIARNQMIQRKQNIELVELLTKAKQVQRAFNKYRTATFGAGINDGSISQDLEQAESLLSDINEQKQLIKDETDLNIERIHTDLRESVDSFYFHFNENNELHTHARKINISLNQIIDRIRAAVNNILAQN